LSAAVVDLVSQAAVTSAGQQPSTDRRTTDQATTAAPPPVSVNNTRTVLTYCDQLCT